MNRNVLNISIFRNGSPEISLSVVPYPHSKGHLLVASLWTLIVQQNCSLNVDPFIHECSDHYYSDYLGIMETAI